MKNNLLSFLLILLIPFLIKAQNRIMKNSCKNYFKLITLFCLALLLTSSASAQLNPGIEAKVNALVKQMTLEEKVGQMAQVSIESLGEWKNGKFVFTNKMNDAVMNYKVGSILNTPGVQSPQEWNRLIAEMQDVAKKTDKKIPILYGLDNVHGVSYVGGATLFPQQIG